MTSELHHVIAFLRTAQKREGILTKDRVEFLLAEFGLVRQRSVFSGKHCAFRVSEVSGRSGSFSNVVLSLSALVKYDSQPFIVCVVREDGLQFLLSNTTLLRKISHSSHRLSLENIKGSFLGHDIIKSYDGLANSEENFDVLFDLHKKIMPQENLQRLVDATADIQAVGSWYSPSAQEISTIIKAPQLFASVVQSREFRDIQETLTAIISARSRAIIAAANDRNINTRGNNIEQIISEGLNRHSAEDIEFDLSSGLKLKIDIKTKLTHLGSSPKAYNVDKILKELAKGNVIFAFLFVFIDIEKQQISTKLISILDFNIINMTRVQFHWAGRNSRGVTQLGGNFDIFTDPKYVERLDIHTAAKFLGDLIVIKEISG